MADKEKGPLIPDSVEAAMPRKRVRRGGRQGCWKPGQSGNPGGRPKTIRDVVASARLLTPNALAALEIALKHDDGRVSLEAAKTLLRWAWGDAPKVALEGDIPKDSTSLLQALEHRLAEMAMAGDKDAVLALLAALAPDRYGRAVTTADATEGTTDVPGWTPRLKAGNE